MTSIESQPTVFQIPKAHLGNIKRCFITAPRYPDSIGVIRRGIHFSFPAYFWASRAVILTCRRAHLLFYTLLFFLSSLLFGIAGRHFGMSTAAFWHVDGHIYYLLFTEYMSVGTPDRMPGTGTCLTCNSENRSLAPLSHLCVSEDPSLASSPSSPPSSTSSSSSS